MNIVDEGDVASPRIEVIESTLNYIIVHFFSFFLYFLLLLLLLFANRYYYYFVTTTCVCVCLSTKTVSEKRNSLLLRPFFEK
uniref:Uncharacterized protein n=1 Tax=Lepeophtheirus salmonis TaxID=72036 RepID=A0A0K2UNE5_LEPSM